MVPLDMLRARDRDSLEQDYLETGEALHWLEWIYASYRFLMLNLCSHLTWPDQLLPQRQGDVSVRRTDHTKHMSNRYGKGFTTRVGCGIVRVEILQTRDLPECETLHLQALRNMSILNTRRIGNNQFLSSLTASNILYPLYSQNLRLSNHRLRLFSEGYTTTRSKSAPL
jgi:hypothetical protein